VISEVKLRYFDGCPNWRTTYDRLRAVLRDEGMAEIEPTLERIETPEDAERLRFAGSPTIIIDGVDPFEEAETAFGLTCRVYRTPDGLAGSPTAEQLSAALHSV
jgi:hypothetical protein